MMPYVPAPKSERERALRHARGGKVYRITERTRLVAQMREELSEARHEALHESVYLPRMLAARAAKLESFRSIVTSIDGTTRRDCSPRIYKHPRFG